MSAYLSMDRIKRWGLKGGLSVLDQAIFSGANFVLSVMLARWLSMEQFGTYTIGFTILIFVYQFYLSFLLEPMSVLGPTHFSDHLKEYLILNLKSHFIITIGAGFFFLVSAFAFTDGRSLVRQILFVTGGTLPLLLLPWYLRRVFYVLGQPAVSLWGSVVYAISLVALTTSLRQFNTLSGPSAILVTAMAGVLSGLFFFLAFRFRDAQSSVTSLASVMMQNWNFGKWLIMSSIFIALGSQVQIWISASLLGVAASGTLRALQVIIQPMMLTITALTALVTPSLSFEYSRGDFGRFRQKIRFLIISLLLLAILFEAFLLLFSSPIEKFSYGGKFSAYAFLLPVWGVIPLALAYSSGIQAGLQAAQRPQAFLVAAILWAAASFGLGVWLTLRLGILGATWSAVLGYLIFVLTLSILYWFWVYRPLVSS
jgi:O-antigen/teichoic acid export membrane protein